MPFTAETATSAIALHAAHIERILAEFPGLHDGHAETREAGEPVRQTAAMPKLTRNGVVRFEPKTIDQEARTVEVTWTTGARVRRHGFLAEDFDEELSLDESAVDLSRLNGGAPLLNSHDAYSLMSVVGVVERAWLQGPKGRREGRATVRFSDRADVEPIWRDMTLGILRNISVGYEVSRWEKVERKNDVPLLRAAAWQPLELSLVPIPADAGAQVRAAGESTLYPCIIESRGDTMAENASRAADEAVRHVRASGEKPAEQPPAEQQPQQAPETVPQQDESKPDEPQEPTRIPVIPADAAIPENPEGPVPNIDAGSGEKKRAASSLSAGDARAIAERAIAAERARGTAIMTRCDKLKLDRSVGQKLVDAGVPLEKAMDALIDARAAISDETAVRNINPYDGGSGLANYAGAVQVTDGGPAKRAAIENAILHRYNPGRFKLGDQARQYMGLKLDDMAREVLEENGVKTRGMGRVAVAEMALKPGYARLGGLHTTSDFATILSNVTNTTLRAGYDAAPRTFTGWARRGTLPDYRPTTRVQLSNMPALLRVREHGEYERGTLTEGKEVIALSKWGRVIGITREVIINDNLDAFTRIPEGFGASAANLESDVVYAVLLANAAMNDGVPLIHATHGNLGVATALGAAPLGAGYSAMMMQKGLDGSTVLSVTPQFLLAPPALISVVQQLLTTLTPAQTANVVPEFIRSLTPVIEPRLQSGVTVDGVVYAGSATAYFLIAAPTMVDTVEYAYLEGEEGVYTETRNGFDVDGVEVKARLDFAAAAMDFRGIHRNVGA
jgi:hypothetical protein